MHNSVVSCALQTCFIAITCLFVRYRYRLQSDILSTLRNPQQCPVHRIMKQTACHISDGITSTKKFGMRAIGEQLERQRERGNATDACVKKRQHCWTCASTLFMRRGGVSRCEVTGRRKHSTDLPQGGLEAPCLLTFEGKAKDTRIKTFPKK